MSVFTWFGKFISGLFHSLKVTVAPMVVSILEVVQGAEDTGLIPGIAKVVDDALGTKIGENVNNALKAEIPKAIAAFLAIEGLPANATEQQEKDFADAVLKAVVSKKAAQTVPGQVISNLGVQIYDIIKKTAAAHADGSKVTAAEIIIDIEEAYQDYQADLTNAQSDQQQ